MKLNRREALVTGAAFVASPLAFASDNAPVPEVPKEVIPYKDRFTYEANGQHWLDKEAAMVYTGVPYLPNLTSITIYDDSPQKFSYDPDKAQSGWLGSEGLVGIDTYPCRSSGTLLGWSPNCGEPSAVVVYGYDNFHEKMECFPRQEQVSVAGKVFVLRKREQSEHETLFRSLWLGEGHACELLHHSWRVKSWSSGLSLTSYDCDIGRSFWEVQAVPSFKARQLWWNQP